MKIISIVGARPEFIQAKPVSDSLQKKHKEIIVHTGQHYDYSMSQSFFDDLQIPRPNYNLKVGSGSHAKQTAEILAKLEQILVDEEPNLVIVRGDTNSTLAASLTASKMHIPIAHIEAGERSYNRFMPEEINRIVTDSIANLHFCASITAVERLRLEGIVNSAFFVGDVMLDIINQALPIAQKKSSIMEQLHLEPKKYSLITLHRAGNTDDPHRLKSIISTLNEINETLVFPVHPRTMNALKNINAEFRSHIRVIQPVGYLDMITLEKNARIIATDSGGVQREAYYTSIPCLTLRDETEWIETIQNGWNLLVGIDRDMILSNWFNFVPPVEHPAIFGDGRAGEKIVSILESEILHFRTSVPDNSRVNPLNLPIKIETIMKAAIVGGGIMGISLAYYLSKRGVHVETYEASPDMGGLAGPIHLEDGTDVDRFYHAILSSDNHLIDLCTDLGISDQLRFRETKMGFYYRGQIHPMNNITDFLQFPPLGWVDRGRLGFTVLYAQLIRDWHKLESVSVEEWLIKLSGRNTYLNIWRPMLKAKFDGNFRDTPATYIWSRLVRMTSTRSGASQTEKSGHLIGGYITLLRRMAKYIVDKGNSIHLHTPVSEITIVDDEATGVRIQDEIFLYDIVISTLQVPIFRYLIPNAPADYHDFLGKTEYLGIIAPLLVLNHPLSDYWTLNITDDRIPFTGVIETTSYIDPKYVNDHYLVYLPKYTSPNSEWQGYSDEEIKRIWLEKVIEMFPKFDIQWVQYFLVHRERYVEPIHKLNETHLIPGVETPVENLYLATTAQIYPGLTNGESVTRHAKDVSDLIVNQII